MSAAAVVVDVWSDYVCPFFCLEEPVFEEVRKKIRRQDRRPLARAVRIAATVVEWKLSVRK